MRLGRALVARKRGLRDRALEHRLPEPPTHGRIGDRRRDAPAKAAHELCKPAIGGRDHRLEPRFQHAPQNRRGAAGRHRDHQRTAVDDRGHDEIGESWPVGDVDERAGLLRHRPRRVDKALVIGRDEAERGAGEILGRRITRLVPKIRTRAQFEKFVAEFAANAVTRASHGREARRAAPQQLLRPRRVRAARACRRKSAGRPLRPPVLTRRARLCGGGRRPLGRDSGGRKARASVEYVEAPDSPMGKRVGQVT